jgi:polyhydroxybutyrate depolymerase
VSRLRSSSPKTAFVVTLALVFVGCVSQIVGGTASSASPLPRVQLASTGCGKTPPVTATDKKEPGDVPMAITVGPQQRTYRLGVPSSYNENIPAPVVMNLHGSGSNAAAATLYTDMPMQAAKKGFITVTPGALGGNWQISGTGTDDAFLMGLLDYVESSYCVNLNSVYAVGFSLGAWKVAITACTHPDRFASIGLVAVEVYPAKCPPMSVVAFHGTADPVVPYGKGADPGVVVTGPNAHLPGVSVNMPQWAKGAGCSVHKTTKRIGTDVEHWRYQKCPRGRSVEFYSIKHGRHTWPGSYFKFPGTTQTIHATKIVLAFFEAHPKR